MIQIKKYVSALEECSKYSKMMCRRRKSTVAVLKMRVLDLDDLMKDVIYYVTL